MPKPGSTPYNPAPEAVRAAWTGMELVGWYVIVPLAVASLLTAWS
jgi:hypothetical protein